MEKKMSEEMFTDYDSGITTQKWAELLNDKSVFTDESLTIMKRFLDFGGEATCLQLAKKYGKTLAVYSATCTQLAKRVSETTLCPEPPKRDNETNRYWPILFTGHKVDKSTEDISGVFVWKLRPELKKALKDFDLSKYKLYEENMSNNENEKYTKFKNLLEYFVAHLEFCVNDENSIGYSQYIEPMVMKKNFFYSGQGYNGNNIQNQIKEWATYENKEVCINVYASNYQSNGNYLNWKGTWLNVRPKWKNNHIVDLYLTKEEGSGAKSELEHSNSELGLFDGKTPNQTLKDFFDKYFEFIKIWEDSKMDEKLNSYITQLKAAHNVIFTGAPGTGKSYLAKQIAIKMIFGEDKKIDELSSEENKIFENQCGFVQFHPSYDYTDFVEGLRPTNPDENGNIGFVRRDGVFKEFCKKALEKEKKNKFSNFDEVFDTFIDDITEAPLNLKTLKQNKEFSLRVGPQKTIYAIPQTEYKTEMGLNKEKIQTYLETGTVLDWKPYLTSICKYIKENYELKTEPVVTENSNTKPFVFIIDEINRGEISKIFGELFFSIDPSYRGEKGKVNTQYQNLIDDGDIFKAGFYVPENVYIIGTMNDIDRSVESMDFAMRRRFLWREITADESAENMNLSDDVKNRMKNLNDAILKIEGLNSSYQIGGAYFLKLEKGELPADDLWNFHIEPLLKEYLRGNPNADKQLKELKKAYNNNSVPKNNSADLADSDSEYDDENDTQEDD